MDEFAGSMRARGARIGSGAPDRRSAAHTSSDATPLARTAAVMRNRRHVANRGHIETRSLNRAQSRLAPRTRARHLDLERAHAMFGRFANGVLRGDLGGERRRLAGAFESHRAGGGPGDRIALS